MNKKNLVVVQPQQNYNSKLRMENKVLLKMIDEAPIGVDTTLPESVNKIDHSLATSPRCVRLTNEREKAIINERLRLEKRITENTRRLSISTLRGFEPFR
jgi:hypothetical protein